MLTLHSTLQLENTFEDPDVGAPDAQLERLVIERNISSEHLDAGQPEGAPGPDGREDAQLTVNGPQLLEKPVPARANPMARLHESGRRTASRRAFLGPSSHAHMSIPVPVRHRQTQAFLRQCAAHVFLHVRSHQTTLSCTAYSVIRVVRDGALCCLQCRRPARAC